MRKKWTFSEVISPVDLKVVLQVNFSVSAGCLQDDVYSFLDLLLKLGHLGMELCTTLPASRPIALLEVRFLLFRPWERGSGASSKTRRIRRQTNSYRSSSWTASLGA
jgi:hypothetical protein